MTVVFCPGIHAPALTDGLLQGLIQPPAHYLVIPSDRYPPYSPLDLLQFLETHLPFFPVGVDLYRPEIVLVAFSAGVVGAIAAAWLWELRGGTVKALIALDGWGVPLTGAFPIHRLSHDALTHWTTFSSGQQSHFVAAPAISHHDLWRSPHQAWGWQTNLDTPAIRTTAAQFLSDLFQQYGELDANSWPQDQMG